MNEIEKTVWELHDKRLSEHEVRFNEATKDFTEIKESIKTILNRINEGISVTQQKILTKNGEIELQIKDLSHSIEIQNLKMNEKVDTVHSQLLERIMPLENSERKTDRIWWAIAGAFIIMIITFVGVRFMDKLWPNDDAEKTTRLSIKH